ncbi:MAG: Gfo/Idh/MocA family protein [Flavobacteriales bacterium]
MLRTGVCGVGHLGRFHVNCLKELGGLVGVYDPDPAAASSAGVPVFSSYADLLDAVDAVVIAAPTPRHVDCAREALARGKHVLIEKPVAPTAAEGASLRTLAAGSTVHVGHIERFNPAYIAALPYLLDARHITAQRLAPFTPRGAEVSVVHDLMIHDLDALLAVRDREVVGLEAWGERVVSDTLDVVHVRLTFSDGCRAVLTASRVSPVRVRSWDAWGTGGGVHVDFAARTAARWTPEGPVDLPVGAQNALLEELRTFLAAAAGQPLAAGVRPAALEDGLRALGLADHITASIAAPTFAS